MKNIGIWLDSKIALIVKVNQDHATLEEVESGIEFFNRTSTSGSRNKWGGTQDITHEQSYLEREKNQFKKYFKQIADTVSNADRLALFGPADINKKLEKELMENYPSIAQKIVAVDKVDSLTENQTIALVREFFKNK